MSASGRLPALNEALAGLHISLIQRDGDPTECSNSARNLLAENLPSLGRLTPADQVHVGSFASRCASLLRRDPLKTELASSLSSIFAAHIGSPQCTLDSACAIVNTALELRGLSTPCQFRPILPMAYRAAVDRWRAASQPLFHATQSSVSTKGMIWLLRGADAMYAEEYRFTPAGLQSSRALLPIKLKIQMEAKLQKSGESRQILQFLRGMRFSRIDAGMCLNVMARTGLYDEDVANMCCDVLNSSSMLLTSRQFTQVMNNLGTLGHRHPNFSSLFGPNLRFRDISAQDLLRHVQGYAMLQLPLDPEDQVQLMDGVWMHSLRSRPRPTLEKSAPDVSHGELIVRSPQELCDFEWYVSMCHALQVLQYRPHKFILHSAREVRRHIREMSFPTMLRLLYGFGGIDSTEVPRELQENWRRKVKRSIDVVLMKCEERAKELDPIYLPTAVQALRQCGVAAHRLLPQTGTTVLAFPANPVKEIISKWGVITADEVMKALAMLMPTHFAENPNDIVGVLRAILGSLENLESQGAAKVAMGMGNVVACVVPHVGALDAVTLEDARQLAEALSAKFPSLSSIEKLRRALSAPRG